jgi:hypothetical protein
MKELPEHGQYETSTVKQRDKLVLRAKRGSKSRRYELDKGKSVQYASK